MFENKVVPAYDTIALRMYIESQKANWLNRIDGLFDRPKFI